jgi:hypothetical protein
LFICCSGFDIRRNKALRQEEFEQRQNNKIGCLGLRMRLLMNRSHLNGEPRAGDDSRHGQPPVLTTQVPMSWVDGNAISNARPSWGCA